MNRRSFLARGGLGAIGAAAAPLAILEQRVDPVLRAILDQGGRVVRYPSPDIANGWIAWVERRGGAVVGFIHEVEGFFPVTTTWPSRQWIAEQIAAGAK